MFEIDPNLIVQCTGACGVAWPIIFTLLVVPIVYLLVFEHEEQNIMIPMSVAISNSFIFIF